MFDWLPEKLVEEMKATPYTMMSHLILIAVVVWLATDHVSGTDFREVKKELGALKVQLQDVDYTLAHDHLDTRKHNIERDLFEVNREITADERTGKPIDHIYYERRDDLVIQRDDVQHDMERLERERRHL